MPTHDVILKSGNPVAFHRTVRGPMGKNSEPGKVKKVLVFEPGEVVKLSAAEFDAVSKDIKKGMLVETAKDSKGRDRPKRPDAVPMVEISEAELERRLDAARREGREQLLDEQDAEVTDDEVPADEESMLAEV